MTQKSKKKGTICIIIGLLLIASALCLIVYNVQDSNRAGQESQKVIEKLEEKIIENTIELPEKIENREMPTIEIDGYKYIGTITIPDLSVELPVMEEWDYPRLLIAPCRYSGSFYQDNMVIAAHNYNSHFGRINRLDIGDEIVFRDVENNKYYYQVAWVDLLNPIQTDNLKYTANGEDWDLTLFTCTYSGQQRYTVRCVKKEKEN